MSTYNIEKLNCIYADDVFEIPSAKDAMMIPMSPEAQTKTGRIGEACSSSCFGKKSNRAHIN